jgi:hypothetical protein
MLLLERAALGFVVLGSLTFHRPGDVRVPWSMVFPFLLILTLSAVKTALQPWSQRTPTDISECCKSLKISALFAAAGRSGICNSPTWLEWMNSPFGKATLTWVGAALTLLHGASKRKQRRQKENNADTDCAQHN